MINEANKFISELRERTALNHAALEQSRLSKALLSDKLTHNDYLAYLRTMYRFIAGAENRVYPLLNGIIGDIESRKKTVMLVSDLAILGLSASQIRNLHVLDFPDLTEASAMGIMYVLEGSTLGGRVLYKHIRDTLGINEKTGAGFFYGNGERTANMWRIFLEDLTSYAGRSKEGERIIRSAENTFHQLEERFH